MLCAYNMWAVGTDGNKVLALSLSLSAAGHTQNVGQEVRNNSANKKPE